MRACEKTELVDLKSIEWILLSENIPDVTQIQPELCECTGKAGKEVAFGDDQTWIWSLELIFIGSCKTSGKSHDL